MPQQLISLGGPAEELSYQLSQGQTIRPETIAAFVDGSGAAAEFAIQVTLRAQSGEVISRTRTDDSFAVGDSGFATFAPF